MFGNNISTTISWIPFFGIILFVHMQELFVFWLKKSSKNTFKIPGINQSNIENFMHDIYEREFNSKYKFSGSVRCSCIKFTMKINFCNELQMLQFVMIIIKKFSRYKKYHLKSVHIHLHNYLWMREQTNEQTSERASEQEIAG